MSQKNNTDLTVGSPFRRLLAFALPVIGGNLFQLFYTLADSIIVGKTLGANALAAVGSTSIIIYLVLCFIQGMTSGCAIVLGQRCGARDEVGMGRSAAASMVLSIGASAVLTAASCLLAKPILNWMNTPADIYQDAYDYMFVVLLGTGATFFYNRISNTLRAMGDSRTPLIYLVMSSLLNVGLDLLFLVPFPMGVAGAAWATVLSQLISALLCLWSGLRKFPVLRLGRKDFVRLGRECGIHLKMGFPMAFQMSVMCIGQLSMQSAVNALGPGAVAGYTAATKADQLSVLIDNAMISTVSSYVSQNYGACRKDRICRGVRAALLQTQLLNALMCAGMLLAKTQIVSLFVTNPTREMISYAEGYLNYVAPCYFFLGLLAIYRSAVQGMQNAKAPFAACIIELAVRLFSTEVLCSHLGYTGVCLASPLAWIFASALLIPVYYRMMSAKYPLFPGQKAGALKAVGEKTLQDE